MLHTSLKNISPDLYRNSSFQKLDIVLVHRLHKHIVNPKEAMRATNSTNAFKYKPAFKKNSKGISTPPTIIADSKVFQRFAGRGILAFL
jgi:hypothetical protein